MKMKIKMILVLSMMMLGLALTGCNTYTEHGHGTIMISNNLSDNAFLSFSTFEGTKVFKLKVKSGDKINYSGSLGTGSATVYYDNGEGKKELFTMSDGDSVEDSLENLEKGTVYIILETDGKAENGKVEFVVE